MVGFEGDTAVLGRNSVGRLVEGDVDCRDSI